MSKEHPVLENKGKQNPNPSPENRPLPQTESQDDYAKRIFEEHAAAKRSQKSKETRSGRWLICL